MSGGNLDITSTVSAFDFDGTATYTGGTITVNGESRTESPADGPGAGGLVAAVPQTAKAVLVDDKKADEITMKWCLMKEESSFPAGMRISYYSSILINIFSVSTVT